MVLTLDTLQFLATFLSLANLLADLIIHLADILIRAWHAGQQCVDDDFVYVIVSVLIDTGISVSLRAICLDVGDVIIDDFGSKRSGECWSILKTHTYFLYTTKHLEKNALW